MDEPDCLHPEIYLPEGDEISHGFDDESSLESCSQLSRSFEEGTRDIWIRGSGQINPAFQPDEFGDNSSVGSHGEFVMDNVIKRQIKGRHLNEYESMAFTDDGGSNKKSVDRYIFGEENENHSDNTTGHDDGGIRVGGVSGESPDFNDQDRDKHSYHSDVSFSTFSKKSGQNGIKSVSKISLNEWKKSVGNVEDHTSSDMLVSQTESNTDDIISESNTLSGENDHNTENFSIAIVPGSVSQRESETQKQSRYKKREGQNKNSRFNSDTLDYGVAKTKYGAVDSTEQNQGQINLYEPVGHYEGEITLGESTDDVHQDTKYSVPRKRISGMDSPGTWTSDDINFQTEQVLQAFDQQIQNLETRKTELGTIELLQMDNIDSSTDDSDNRERRGTFSEYFN